jgi:hypothetical protein
MESSERDNTGEPDSVLIWSSVSGPPAQYSLLRHCPLLVLSLIVLTDVWQKTDPDLWGHIRFGQEMLSSRHIPLRDSYSYTAFGHPWLDHEYLTEIIMAAAYNIGGVVGLKIWKLACITATILMLTIGMAETHAGCLIQLNTLVVGAAVLASHIQFRPQIHTYALFALTLALLARDNYRGSAPLWLMVPLMALWSSLHGGFVVGLITLATYAVALGLLAFFKRSGFRHCCRLGLITIIAAAATLLPPNGFNAWRAVLTAVCNPMTYRIIVDWQPLSTAMIQQWEYSHYGIVVYLLGLALYAALVLSVVVRPRGGDFPLVLIALLMCLAALKAVRNVPLAAIACVIPVTRHLGLLPSRHAESSAANVFLPIWAQWAIAGGAILLTGSEIFSSRLPTDIAYPSGAVNFMKERQLAGNVLTDFGWGEYLIWHLAPDSKVFVDGRYDTVYPQRVLRDYLTFNYWMLPGADKVLTGYAHNFVMISPNVKAYEGMISTPGWNLIYKDRNAALFELAGPRETQRPRTPVAGVSSEIQYFP